MTGETFEALLAPNLPSMRRLVQMRMRTTDHADDVIQQTLLRAFVRRDQLRASSKFSVLSDQAAHHLVARIPADRLPPFRAIAARKSRRDGTSRVAEGRYGQTLRSGPWDYLPARSRGNEPHADGAGVRTLQICCQVHALSGAEAPGVCTSRYGAARASWSVTGSAGNVHRLACL